MTCPKSLEATQEGGASATSGQDKAGQDKPSAETRKFYSVLPERGALARMRVMHAVDIIIPAFFYYLLSVGIESGRSGAPTLDGTG